MLMLDDYRHVYIGQAWDMRLFINAHGSGIKQCDRLIWGHDLVLSIDASARHGHYPLRRANNQCRQLGGPARRDIPPDYLLNRIRGEGVTGLGGLSISRV